MAAVLAFSASAEECHEGVDGSGSDGVLYAWRAENVCEGVCSTDVSGRGLELASLHLGEAGGNLPEGDLLLRWRNDRSFWSRLHIRSIDPSLCYRVDARLPPGVDSFLWDTSLARKVGLTLDRLGFVVRSVSDQRRMPILLPSARDGSSLVILAVPEFPLIGLTARLVVGREVAREQSAPECAAGEPGADGVLKMSSEQRAAAGDSVRLLLADPPACGPWELELAATPAPGVGIGPMTRIVPLHMGAQQ